MAMVDVDTIAAYLQSGPKKAVPRFSFCDNCHKCTPILTILLLLQQEMYDA